MRRQEYQKQRHHQKHEAKKSTENGRISSGAYSNRSSSGSLPQQQQQLPAAMRHHSHQHASSVGSSPRIGPNSLNRVKPPPVAVSSTPPITASARLPNSPPMCSTPSSTGSRSSSEMKEESKNIQVATQLFYNHDVKNKGRLTAEELQKLLQNDDCTHFCISAIDSLINLFGATRFGTINQSEFVSLSKE